MDVHTLYPEPGSSWSEKSTPDSDDVEEIVRQRPVSGIEYALQQGRPRLMRPPIRRRLRMEELTAAGRAYHAFRTSVDLVDHRRSSDRSNSSSSTATAVTSANSSCTDPWSSKGFVEEEDEGFSWGKETDMLLEPKVEPQDVDLDITNFAERGSLSPTTPCAMGPSTAAVIKRPRGRPRKHPKSTLESLAKIQKGRSKTGCITCRKRKKKCDETKPGCINCEKNSVKCEGYPEKALWRSGKEKAAEGTRARRIQQRVSELIASPTEIRRRVSLPTITLPPVIHCVETSGDQFFFHHYISKLSTIFTVEPRQDNAFKSMLLPMAAQHVGLMHSILALSSKHIDYRSPYGVQFLQAHPDLDIPSLEERSQYHQNRAYEELNADIARQVQNHDSSTIPATLGQMICMVLQTLADENPQGTHRWHLQAYKTLTKTCPPEDGEATRFFHEFFQYHICADELICLPKGDDLPSDADSDSWNLPSTVLQPAAVRMLGVHDGLFRYMSQITNIRNKIRINIQRGIDPVVDHSSLYRASQIDAGIRDWRQPWPVGDPRDLPAMLYKQMMWVYLWRTIYPPKTTTWRPDSRITQAVDDGIRLLEHFKPDDPSLTLVLAPAFVLGCAAFEPEQRAPIRRAIAVVKAYMGYRNADTALVVLEEVWRLMDMRDERSWDWQWIASNMGIDFLAT